MLSCTNLPHRVQPLGVLGVLAVVHGARHAAHPRLELPALPGAAHLLRHAAAGHRQHHPHPAQGLHLPPQDGRVLLQVRNCHTWSLKSFLDVSLLIRQQKKVHFNCCTSCHFLRQLQKFLSKDVSQIFYKSVLVIIFSFAFLYTKGGIY